MKRLITIFSILLLIIGLSPNKSYTQSTNNVLMEYCTGTWCGWCPPGHEIINGIVTNYPNTVVLAYHGGSGDPWLAYSQGIRSLFGFLNYPAGAVGRRTGVIYREAWNNNVVIQANTIQPGVNIEITNKSYDAVSRTLTATVVVTPRVNLNGEFYVNYVLTENNLVYPQRYYPGCSQQPCYYNDYVHKHVVKQMMNGDLGELIHSGDWTIGQQVTRNLSYVIPTAPQVMEANNCDLNVFVYKQGSSISINSDVQQAMKTPITGVTGISNTNENPGTYSLSQNYPNPFNPSTNIRFSIPKDGNVSLKFYDVLGNEVASYIDGFLKAGVYNAQFDGVNLSSGIYFYKLIANNFNETRKMILSK